MPPSTRAIEECFPRSARQRCLAHRMRNLAVKVPADQWPEFKARITACYQAPSRAIARDLRAGIMADYADSLPTAVRCFDDDFEACVAHLRLPVTHRRSTRTTNLIERLFGEERRRLKIVPNAFGEKPVLKLMFAALIRAAEAGEAYASPNSNCVSSTPSERIWTPTTRPRSPDQTGRLGREFPASQRLDQSPRRCHAMAWAQPIHCVGSSDEDRRQAVRAFCQSRSNGEESAIQLG